jgi:hypothetical protein
MSARDAVRKGSRSARAALYRMGNADATATADIGSHGQQ